MQEPEEKSIGSMDVDSNFLFDFDGNVIMVCPTFTLVISLSIATGNSSAG
jgi:hypothetical protein